jgi:ParB-like chromosome segregation protein Spo0J
MNAKKLSVDDLKEYPNNARRGNVSVLVESLKVNGQYRPIVVQQSTNYVLAGNHLLRAAKQLGWDEIDAVILDVDDEQALKIVLVDNRSNDLGEYNDDLLTGLLKELEDFSGTGYTEADIEELEKLGGVEQEERPDIEFSLALREENNYVVLVFDNALDWQAAITTFDLKTVKAWDSRPGFSRAGIGRVINGTPILDRLNNVNS